MKAVVSSLHVESIPFLKRTHFPEIVQAKVQEIEISENGRVFRISEKIRH